MPDDSKELGTSAEKDVAAHDTQSTHAQDDSPANHSLVLPRGWLYKKIRVFGNDLWYAHPGVQLGLVAFVCFLDPGMYNALSGVGAGGLEKPRVADNANMALYSTFAIVAFFSGSITNWLGVRTALGFGGIGYCLYSASLLCYKHTENYGFVVFAGAWLGICAGMLWTGQGTIMVAYPNEQSKGRYIAWFWMIFNLGAVIGSAITLGQNAHNAKSGAVSDGTYAAFIALSFVGFLLCFTLCNGNQVIRADGSRVILMKNPSWKTEFIGLYQTITGDPWVVLLFPMFFASNIFYTYQFSDFNGLMFDVRSRSLNNLLYWFAQIFGAWLFGYMMDIKRVRRSLRAKIAWSALFVLTFAIWGGGYAWQKKQFTRSEVLAFQKKGFYVKDGVKHTQPDYFPYDWTDGGEKYVGPLFLYFFYGFFDAVWQTTIYWIMGALSNSGRKAANLVGFYKGIQSAGAAIFWRLDGIQTPIDQIFGATWGILAGSLLIAAPIIFLRVKDEVPLEEDLKFSNETAADVLGFPDENKKSVDA